MTANIIVVDLDGTLCNSGHREHLAVAGHWDDFHALLRDDEPWPDVLWLLENVPQATLIGLTGRNERYRPATLKWLEKYDIWFDVLLMRPDDNYQSDHELKPKMLDVWLDELGFSHADVLFILEDRERVTEAFRNLGHNVWQVRSPGY